MEICECVFGEAEMSVQMIQDHSDYAMGGCHEGFEKGSLLIEDVWGWEFLGNGHDVVFGNLGSIVSTGCRGIRGIVIKQYKRIEGILGKSSTTGAMQYTYIIELIPISPSGAIYNVGSIALIAKITALVHKVVLLLLLQWQIVKIFSDLE